MIARSFITLPVASCLIAVGCAAPPVSRAPAPAPTPTPITAAPEAPTRSVRLSDEIVAVCKIHFGTVAEAPKFDYDKSAILDEDRGLLEQVATCVQTGALKGRALRLIGRADPRGEDEYNMALGQRRAGNVRQYLLNLGLDRGRVSETSRGEMDATGTTEAGWQLDRRVDIILQ